MGGKINTVELSVMGFGYIFIPDDISVSVCEMPVVSVRRNTSVPFKVRDVPFVKFSTFTLVTVLISPAPAKVIR